MAKLIREVTALHEEKNRGDAGHEALVQQFERNLPDSFSPASSGNRAKFNAAEENTCVTKDDVDSLRTELENRLHELETVQNTLRQREEEISKMTASLKLARQHSDRVEMKRRVAEDRLDFIESKLKVANEWISRLVGGRKIAEDRAAKVEARLAAAEKAMNFTALELSSSDSHKKQISTEMTVPLRQDEKLMELADGAQWNGEDSMRRLAESQLEIVTLSEMLRQSETALAAIQLSSVKSQAHLAETRLLSNMLKTSEGNADRNVRQVEWLQKINATIIGYPHWWALAPKRWRMRWQQGRLLRKGLFDSEAYLARYPDVLASGMDPLRHYIIHGMNENRTF